MPKNNILKTTLLILPLSMAGCSTVYYNAMEKVGFHKRDIMVDRVESARDSQADAQEEFKDALEKFSSVVTLQDSNGLKSAYESLNDEYEDSVNAAEEVSNRIEEVQDVSVALFEEWEQELSQYTNANLKRSSQRQLSETKNKYSEMMRSMRQAEKSMQPVLNTFRDNVLFLKHNLNAQAIGSLKGEFGSLQNDIQRLISTMNQSIEESNSFIASMKQAN